MSIPYWCFTFSVGYRLDQMRINFLYSLNDSLASPANVLFKLLGNHELEILCVKYKIKSDSTHVNRTYSIWTAFGDNTKDLGFFLLF